MANRYLYDSGGSPPLFCFCTTFHVAMTEETSIPNLIEIKKYQNRRFYDTTNSRHLSLEKIHQLICQGHEIQVTDGKTGQDITNKILAQILLEYEPMKLDFFSPGLLTQVIRMNDLILKDFYETYFNQALKAFVSSKDQFETLLRQSQSLPFSNPMSGDSESSNPFARWMTMNPFAPAPSPAKPPEPKSTEQVDEMEELRKQLDELREMLKQKPSP